MSCRTNSVRNHNRHFDPDYFTNTIENAHSKREIHHIVVVFTRVSEPSYSAFTYKQYSELSVGTYAGCEHFKTKKKRCFVAKYMGRLNLDYFVSIGLS